MVAAFGLLLGGCAVPKEVNPVEIWRRVSGAADEGRLPPPGMDLPSPNLASVPPRPERPTPESRAALTAALAADRASSRGPVILRQVPDGTGTTSPGSPPVPGAPPRPPSFAAAPVIPWNDVAPPRASRAELPASAVPTLRPGAAPPPPPRALAPEPEPALPELPDEAPAPPPPDLLAPPRNR
ncbi:hypothetical protein GCM10011504_31890 [Siccirubricoccus deserti]|nr:hypothetical protein GCM10011504_31890 [Siccirubricoccus deserti]